MSQKGPRYVPLHVTERDALLLRKFTNAFLISNNKKAKNKPFV